jgi:predicted ATPase/DNA-binding SARP family transcriptional activator
MSGRRRSELRIELLGGFRVRAGDVVVDEAAWRLRRARGLVKLLALTPEHSLHREQVIEALWPGHDPATASNSLRQALFVARRALDSGGDDGATRLALTQDVITLGGDGLQVDVEQFEAAAAAAQATASVDLYREAVGLYRGELLPEDRFEEWLGPRRQALRERHLTLLVDLARLHEAGGEHAAALAALQQTLVEDPLHEPAHRMLMLVYALTGRRQRALAQFHLLRESLRREFEDEPDDETRSLYREILARRLDAEDGSAATPAAGRPESPRRRANNLPLQLTTFVGRDRELEDVVGLVRRHRLVTLSGPGGCGKTRLGLEAAAALAHDVDDGIWLVELAGISDVASVASGVAAVLGVESRSARPSEQAVVAHIGERQMLVVLDNCEHLIGACARLAERLLTSCPNLRIIATSREPLHIAGEVDWRVPSLTPREAQRLFAERARSASSRFVLSDENTEAVAEVCRRVDGIPLAVELAAARVGVLAVAQIAERLRDSIGVLVAGRRTALTRQQTLAATLDWSHQLLDEHERALFCRLGVFAGSFDLAAVEGVCSGDLDTLGRLVDKSLVTVEEHDGTVRYRLLDTVRHYARERLEQAGQRRRLEARHRAHYLEVAERLKPTIDAGDTRLRLALEADELRFALGTGLRAEPGDSLRLTAALWRYWHDRGDRTEGARWLQAALTAAPEPSALRAEALHGFSVLMMRIGDHDRALTTAEAAVALFRGSSDRQALAEQLHHLGTLAWVFADYQGFERHCAESRGLAEEAGDPAIVASVIHTLGVVAAERNDTAAGRELIGRSIELLRELAGDGAPLLLPVARGGGRMPTIGSRPPRLFLEQTFVTARRVTPAGAVAYALCDLAAVLRDSGQSDASRELLDESLLRFRQLGDDLGAAQAMCQLGNLLSAEGDHESAAELHAESLAARDAAGDARGVGLSLLAMSVAAARAANPTRARDSVERALQLFERTDDGPGRAASIVQLGYVSADEGRLREARTLQERALSLWTAFAPNTVWSPPVLFELAQLDTALGDPARATDRLRQAAEVLTHIGDRAGLAYCEAQLSGGPKTPR